jgi:nanoRNase/pAp phosphatase (c-di-AMP/oligoRNAs hydrolase)
METQPAAQLITDSKNIYLISSQGPEAMSATLALFYTLKESGKNVNLILESLPENLKFLSPSLDFISYPKNFVISIPSNVAKVSQIHYEKTENDLKVHLTIENGIIKKDNLSFYFAEAKPDLIITLGVKDYKKQLSENLNSYGFLMESPILNIDNSKDNDNFGRINLIEDKPLAEMILAMLPAKSKEASNCLLASLVISTDNFKNKLTAEVFEMAGSLMKNGADLEQIQNNIFKNA